MKGIVLLTAAVCLMVSSTALCLTWYIEPDGTGDAPTIQAGIDSASVGDTVLVAPGSYDENLVMKGGITLTSVAGWNSTSIEPAVWGLPIITCEDSIPGAVIKGFTLENGDALMGGAVKWSAPSGAIIENRLANNHSSDDGGAISCSDVVTILIQDNVFDSNIAGDWGGAVFCSNSPPVLTSNTFTNCSAKFGGAVGCYETLGISLSSNTFAGNSSRSQGGAVYCNHDCSGVLEDNNFRGNSSAGTGGAVGLLRGTYEARGSLFAGNSAEYGGAIGIGLGTSVIIETCTFYANLASRGSSINSSDASRITVYNCIVANSQSAPAIDCWDNVASTLDCNDLWSNFSDYDGCTPGPSDFYEDPLFCDPAGGDFTLEECSPCVDGYGCGQVGAYGIGCPCGGVAIVPTTWGAIKSMYR